jgi:N-acetyl-anhydromuramyl-L-alanine amidase AmpD
MAKMRPATLFAKLTLPCTLLGLAGAAAAQPDYPPARWVQADPTNFTVSNRPTSLPILFVIIHITEGSYAGAISWFRNPASNVSAHYVLRSSDGEVTQMVRHRDIGWHAGSWWYNQRSIGIEHEAFSAAGSERWYTPALYRASADLTRFVTQRYGIARNRSTILGHREVSERGTICPGPFWNWATYMALVQSSAAYDSATIPVTMAPGQAMDVVLRFVNNGDIAWNATGAGRVLLGTQNPANRASPFVTTGAWLSSSRPAAVFANAAPGGVGEFRFRLTAPATPGTYTESFQPFLEGLVNTASGTPTAEFTPNLGWFGPIATFQINVDPHEVIVDNTSPNFTRTGTWTRATAAPDKFGEDYWFTTTAAKTRASASWFLNAPRNGVYDVFAWWSQGTNRPSSVVFSADSTRGTVFRRFDQRTNGGRWNLIGRVRLVQGTGFVRVSAVSRDTGKALIADAVRLSPVALD